MITVASTRSSSRTPLHCPLPARETAKAKANLKKSWADAAAMPGYNILKIEKDYSEEKNQTLP